MADDISKDIREAVEKLTTPDSNRDYKYWHAELRTARKKLSTWHETAQRVVDRYLDKRTVNDDATYVNLFAANTQILQSALFARLPQPDVSRRYRDSRDQVGRVASMLVQRAVSYELEASDYSETVMENIILDYLITGLGVGWNRYDIEKKEADVQITTDTDETSEDADAEDEVTNQSAVIDYVHWKDFYWSPARTWDEVTWIARRVHMDKASLIERFGEDGAKVPMRPDRRTDEDEAVGEQRIEQAEVYEIWDKSTKKVFWVCLECDYLLDEQDDPLKVKGFFPTPQPLFANVTSSELMPKPDFKFVEDQYNQLDELNNRISNLANSIAVRGAYDASFEELGSILTDAPENTMIAVERWASLAEKGGLKGAMDFAPIEPQVQAIAQLQKAAEVVKAQIYELTGISDIVRGQSQQYVSAQAESMKGQYASQRLGQKQQTVAKYMGGLIKIQAHIICEFFDVERILQRCGTLFESDRQYVIPALQLLKDDGLRDFSIRVTVDSLQMPDWNADKKGKTEAMMGITQFLGQAIPALKQTPELAPIALNLLRWSVTGYKGVDEIEGQIEDSLQAIEQETRRKAANPQPEKPSPEEIKLQIEQVRLQNDQQIAQAKIVADQERAKDQLALDSQRAATEAQIAQIKAEADKAKAAAEYEIKQRELALREKQIALEEMKMMVEIRKGQGASNTSLLQDLVAVQNGEPVDNFVNPGDLTTEVQNVIAQESARHFTKEEQMALLGKTLQDMQAMFAATVEAINTAVNTPMPPQTIDIVKTDTGLKGTIQ